MARGSYNKELPKVLWFLSTTHSMFGPYMKKPTALFKKNDYEGAETKFIKFKLNEWGNYIRDED
jgi:hypothetical protein